MKILFVAVCSALFAMSSLAQAQEKKKEQSEKQKAQQSRMKDCNKQAADKKMKGDERKGFMSNCLKG